MEAEEEKVKSTHKEGKVLTPKGIVDQVQKILDKRGSGVLEMARQAVLEEKIECREAREALRYFMTKYWHDRTSPTLLSLACEAVNGDLNTVAVFAMPMILIGGAVDIHDDLIDKSKRKDQRPTVYGKFGEPIALLVGDALLFKGFSLLHEACRYVSPDKVASIMSTLKDLFFELGDAEASELKLRMRRDVKPEEYLYVVEKKAADLEGLMRIGAIIGNGSEEEITMLGRYGRILGMLSILRDDFIDMSYFEEIAHRIAHECLPLPILYALEDPKAKSQIYAILSKKKLTRKSIKLLSEIVKNADGLVQQKKKMNELAIIGKSALDHIRHCQKPLVLLIDFMLQELE